MTQIVLSEDTTLDLERGCLLRAGRPVHLRRQTYEVLRYLAQQRGRLVGKERFIEEIWQGRAVTDASLAKCIEELREAVGERAAGLIRTVRGRGYILDLDERTTVRNPRADDAPGELSPTGTIAEEQWPGAWLPEGADAIRATRRYGRVAAATAFAALMLAAAWLVSGGRPTPSVRPYTSVAVLPIANGSGDPEFDYVSDGITASVIHRLSQLTGLKVISHTAVLRYKSRTIDTQATGRELGVEAVLTGRLLKRNNGVTLALELVDTRDNSHVWGGQYERETDDIAMLEQVIAVDLADTLRATLNTGSRQALARAYTDDAAAHELYLKGRYAWEKWTVQGSKQAVAYFEEAIKRDPEFALAYAGLADAYLFGAESGAGLPRREAERRGRSAAMTALSMDPRLAEARGALGSLLVFSDYDFDGGERELKQALRLNFNYAEGHHLYSHLLLALGRYDESLRESQQFLELDPVSESPIGHLAWHYLWARQYDDSIAWSLKDRQLYPEAPQPTLEAAYYQKGQYREAADALLAESTRQLAPKQVEALRSAFARSGIQGLFQRRIEQLQAVPEEERNDFAIATFHARLGDKEAALRHLEVAFANRSGGLVQIGGDVRFDNVRDDPRFIDLLRRIGLPHQRFAPSSPLVNPGVVRSSRGTN